MRQTLKILVATSALLIGLQPTHAAGTFVLNDQDEASKLAIELAQNKMGQCLLKLPTPNDGIENEVTKVIGHYVMLCGQEFMNLMSAPSTTITETGAKIWAIYAGYQVFGCQIKDSDVDKPEGTRLVTCVP